MVGNTVVNQRNEWIGFIGLVWIPNGGYRSERKQYRINTINQFADLFEREVGWSVNENTGGKGGISPLKTSNQNFLGHSYFEWSKIQQWYFWSNGLTANSESIPNDSSHPWAFKLPWTSSLGTGYFFVLTILSGWSNLLRWYQSSKCLAIHKNVFSTMTLTDVLHKCHAEVTSGLIYDWLEGWGLKIFCFPKKCPKALNS